MRGVRAEAVDRIHAKSLHQKGFWLIDSNRGPEGIHGQKDSRGRQSPPDLYLVRRQEVTFMVR
jgi:hypothetical protein